MKTIFGRTYFTLEEINRVLDDDLKFYERRRKMVAKTISDPRALDNDIQYNRYDSACDEIRDLKKIFEKAAN